MAKPELGVKRQCLECSAKFFDFNRDPVVCPKCAAIVQTAPPPRSAARQQASAEDPDVETGGPEIISLEEADGAEEKAVVVEDEVELEDDVGPDDSFLEEEEADADDVTGLIDGDLEDDEET